MARVYKQVGGEKLVRLMARHADTQARLQQVAETKAGYARAILSVHRSSGDSEILVERGRIDRYVTLSDERGQGAARAIEFGTKRSEAVAPLHKAFNLRVKER